MDALTDQREKPKVGALFRGVEGTELDGQLVFLRIAVADELLSLRVEILFRIAEALAHWRGNLDIRQAHAAFIDIDAVESRALLWPSGKVTRRSLGSEGPEGECGPPPVSVLDRRTGATIVAGEMCGLDSTTSS
jgi:hypothetical protein